MPTDDPSPARHAWAARTVRTLLATLCLAAAPWAAQAQATLAQFWEFDDPAGTTLPGAAPGFEGGATWSPGLAGVATDGAGTLRLGWNSTSFGDSFAPLNIGEAGVASFTVRVNGWSIANGAGSGTARPFWSLGLRSAAAVSGSVVAEVEFTALSGGVDVLVRDAQSNFTAQRFQLPSVLPGPLTLSLTVDKTSTPRSWRLDYAVVNGNSGSVGGTLGNTSAGRNISHLMLSVRGNHPNGGNNTPASIDRIEASWEEAPVSFDPPVGGGGAKNNTPPPSAALRDREGNYWFISNRDGLFRARRQVVAALPAELPGARHSLYPLLTNDDGSVWIGTDGVGLLHWQDGQLQSHRPSSREGMLSVLGNIQSIHRDRAGELWINGLWRYRAGQYLPAPWQARLLSDGYVFAWAMADADGVYWIGTGGGLYRADGVNHEMAHKIDGLDGDSDRLTRYTEADGLAGDDVRVLLFGRDGALWAGGTGGLSRIDGSGIRRWTAADGLVGTMVRALHEDPDGTLWIGTYDAGLYRLRNDRLVSFDRSDGLFDDGVFVILEDDRGQFWMCSNRGIHRVARADLEAHAAGRLSRLGGVGLNHRDGMPSSECNGGRQPAGGRTPDGRLWFPTMAGVAIVDPAEVRPSRKPPPVALEGMRIDGRPMPEVDWLAAQAPGAPPIVIRPEQKSFDITYTGLSFINSEALQFRYRLLGADPNWIEAGTRRTAYFSHLRPGDYVFEVLAATADGVWAETGPALRLRIEAQLWRRPGFWVAVALALSAMVGVLLLLRESRNRRRVAAEARAQHAFARQLIASQEGERKRIAAELHDSLGQNLLVMLNRAQLGLLSAEPGTPAGEQLANIRDAARDALEEVRTISHNLRPHHLDRLGLTQTIEVMLQRIADSGAISVVNELVPIDDRVSAEDAITVYRVLQECLNNVLKHSRASEVRVGCERDVDSVLFWITDNGVGFDYTATVARAGGFGLVGLAERVQMLGGRWSVESTPGAGTTVSVRLQAVQGIEPEPPGE